MTRSGHARKFARKTLHKTGGAARKVMCVQMLLYTLIIAAAAALFELDIRGILDIGLYRQFVLPGAAYLIALVNLLINVPLTAIARKSSEGAFSRMNFGRVLIAILLAILPAAVVWGLSLLASLINMQWQLLLNWVLDNTTNMILGCAAVVAGLLLILYFTGVIGVFSRELMLYMADNPDHMKGSSVGRIVRNGFGHAFVPELLVLRSLFWFLLLIIITAGLIVGACFITSSITVNVPTESVGLPAITQVASADEVTATNAPDATAAPDAATSETAAPAETTTGEATAPTAQGRDLSALWNTVKEVLQDLAGQLAIAILVLPPWAIGAVIILGCVWVLGFGLVFWPRFSMMRLYYHRLIMRDTEVM